MSHNYLLEIGLEEIPAHVVTPSINQLATKVEKFLKDNRLDFESIEKFSTPRRLTIRINGLADKQADIEEDAKGPAKKIAQDADGNWTKAAIGFTRGQGATVDDITFKEVKGTEYVFVHKLIKGQSAKEVLGNIKDVIESMNFPTMMRWANFDFKFIRPIRWMVSLLDDEVLPINILDVDAGRVTRGHRFLGHDVSLDNAKEYEAKLRDEFVIVDANERKQLIANQIKDIAESNNWIVTPNADLLEEVNNLVEWPTAFNGSFNKKYLAIPEEVLITSMRDHQRFFYVRDQDGKLLPNFISVRNGNDEYIENVIRGNEKVLTARLEDAAFFYNEDQKHDIQYYVDRLKKVSFHDKIGTMYEKMQRVTSIAKILGNKFKLDEEQMAQLNRAAQIYKFDLVTGMVGEFSELQGIMGEKYAQLMGESPVVAQAIREHYMPTSAEGNLPESLVGTVLSLADKFDNIYSFFSVGMIPSGSNDPYALRRNAYGIVRILADRQWHLNLADLAQEVKQQLDTDQTAFGVNVENNQKDVLSFFNDRIKKFMDRQKVKHDIEETVLSSSTEDVSDILTAAKILQGASQAADFKDNIEALTRVQRIAAKNENNTYEVKEALFENESEKALNAKIESLEKADLDLEDLFKQLMALQPIISKFFDQTMVMAKEKDVKDNRLNMMSRLNDLILHIGDLTHVLVK